MRPPFTPTFGARCVSSFTKTRMGMALLDEEVIKEFNWMLDIMDKFDDRLTTIEEEFHWLVAKLQEEDRARARLFGDHNPKPRLRWDAYE